MKTLGEALAEVLYQIEQKRKEKNDDGLGILQGINRQTRF